MWVHKLNWLSCNGMDASSVYSTPGASLSTTPHASDQMMRLTRAIWSAICRRPSSSLLIWAACSSRLSNCTPPHTHTHTHTQTQHKHKVILVTIELPHTNTNLYISRSQLIKSDPFTAFLHHICDIIGVTRGQIKQVKGHPNPVSINTTVLFLITLRLKLINATFINLN